MASAGYRPSAPLSHLVDMLWLYDGSGRERIKERALPTGTIELVINLGDDCVRVFGRHDTETPYRFRDAVISGVHTEHFVIESRPQDRVIGVHFSPGGAFPFFPLPPAELLNRHVDLETLWGKAATELRERLLAAESATGKFTVLERFLLTQAQRSAERSPVVAYALNALNRRRPISDIVVRTGYSQRRFIQMFRAEVGLTPKQYGRIARFQHALGEIRQPEPPDWRQLALDSGFYDQSHLINEFQAFSGLSPTNYLKHLRGRKNHPVLTA